jgi:tetratricopeptide (TPR) repeat protein
VPSALTNASLKSFLRRPPVVVSLLSIIALLAFFAVTHLVHRFREQEKGLARHLYAQGQAEMESGKPDRAVTYFRAALSYDRSAFQYQLNLARALRDTGRTDESKSYLMSLWESSPDDGAVNLALGRLAVREDATDEAIHYYHNATYGIWASDPEIHRRNAQFELVDFLLKQNAGPQAEAELITLAASLPLTPELEIQVAQRFARLKDYEHAFSEYESVAQYDRQNMAAQEGAGEAAFQLHRYSTAQKYLSVAEKGDPRNEPAEQLLKTAGLIIQIDPFIHRISGAERGRRIRLALDRAGERLDHCVGVGMSKQGTSQYKGKQASDESKAENKSVVENNEPQDHSSSNFTLLRQNWLALRPTLSRRRASIESDAAEQAMDLVFQIETQMQRDCGEPTDIDQALLLLGQDRDGADR